MEDLCKDDTSQTTCDDDNELCVTYKMEFRSNEFEDFIRNDVMMNQHRCAKESDVKDQAHCEDFEDWHHDLYYGDDVAYYEPIVQKCEAEITKRGKIA